VSEQELNRIAELVDKARIADLVAKARKAKR
jgi:hypothetical protein